MTGLIEQSIFRCRAIPKYAMSTSRVTSLKNRNFRRDTILRLRMQKILHLIFSAHITFTLRNTILNTAGRHEPQLRIADRPVRVQ
jgi:hypothetical protein